MIAELIEQKRGPELAAITQSSPLLSGLNDQQREAYERSFISKHAAAELREKEQIGTAFDAFDVAQRAAGELVKGFTDPGKLAEIERGVAAAEAAAEALKQSLQ